jgi:ATP-dependent Lon protease
MENRRRSPQRTRRAAGTATGGLLDAEAELHWDDAEHEATMRELPVLPIRNAVILPNMVVPLFVEREGALKAIEDALARDRMILAVTQIDQELENPTSRDLFRFGTECSIGRVLRMPDGSTSVLVQGQRRARIERWTRQTPYGCARATLLEDTSEDSPDLAALMRAGLSLVERCSKLGTKLTEDTYIQALNIDRPGALADYIVAQLEPPIGIRQQVLELLDPAQRLRRACELISAELRVLELERKIQDEVQQEVDRGQREFYLREQLRVIQRELGEHDPAVRENLDLRERILARHMPSAIEARAMKEADRLEAMPSMAPEYGVVRTYLDWLTSLPWQERTPEQIDLAQVAATLDANHYGLSRVKDRILEHIAVRKLAPQGRTPILCFAGPPGVGKTSLGKSIADALGRTFIRVSLGGVRDEAEIRGHRRTYVGALPGRLIQSMKMAQTVNPLFVLDEIDKLAADFRGDPASALLEVLDPEQNHAFSDHYLEVPFDLSQVFFIVTANVLANVPAPLRDRLEVIEIAGYTEEEKLHIARDYLISRQLRDTGLSPARAEVDDEAIRRIVRDYTYESGVRGLEREIGSIMRKVARRVAEGRRAKAVVTASRVGSYLGPQKFFPGEAEERDEVGVAMGLAWTAAGGDLTSVEVMAVPGHGAVSLTGQLGDVMKESAHAAITYTRARAERFGLPLDFHETHDLHIHFPSGGIPKDGPSAGITMAVAIISALTGRPVLHDVAMTGEITLRGRVLPVGGIKEKVLAAHRAGIRTVILPRRNVKDLDEVSAEVRETLHVVPADGMDDVLDVALLRAPRDPGAQDPTPPLFGARTSHPHTTVSDPIAASGRVARPRVRRQIAVAP